MSRGQYILRRLIQMIPVVFGITVITFVLIRAIPGDPAQTMLGEKATDAQIALYREKMGLNDPVYVQYFYYMRDLVRFDLGTSTQYRVPVKTILWDRLKVSLSVMLMTLVLTTVISIPLGMMAALKKDSFIDNVVRSTLMVSLLMPTFYTGILIIILLSIKVDLFPTAGYGEGFIGHVHHLFLPGLTLALGISPILIRTLRTGILESMTSDYVKTARSKGLAEQTVVTRHVLRNALIPTVTLLGISVGAIIGGTVVTEKVFALPGAGALLVDAINARDYSTVQAAVMIVAILVVLVNLLTDLVYSFIDPRVRLG
ncbi:MAG TPA: ABC transporter permease [Thermomicrobiales bacterium]|nr:ABC transporter permease [Thermomicrobiales bacterium]